MGFIMPIFIMVIYKIFKRNGFKNIVNISEIITPSTNKERNNKEVNIVVINIY